jgi:UDP-N-acetylmuramyl pentapeptide phosphotransferase/UDP-N-acetylglucosamine-1-phosphate transferase
MVSEIILFGFGFGTSWWATGVMRRYALRKELIDIPNERSSHTHPIPRGGGLAIAAITLGALVFYWLFNPVWPWKVTVAYGSGAGLVATVSWVDDLRSIPNRLRFAAHSLAAVLAIIGLGHWAKISIPLLGQVHLGWLGLPVTFIWVVGLTNAYNFMDGIDGIAGGQAVVAGVGWAIVGLLMDLPFVFIFAGLLASTALGFLFHNRPPARIFLGDVGSAFLGFSFACLAIAGASREPSLAIAGVLLVWPFVFDTLFTFFRRLKNRENVFAAHRSHLYQRLVISGYSHQTVTLLYMGLDVLGLLLALLVLKKNVWTDLTVVVTLTVCCFALWGSTVIREKRQLQEIAKQSHEVSRIAL